MFCKFPGKATAAQSYTKISGFLSHAVYRVFLFVQNMCSQRIVWKTIGSAQLLSHVWLFATPLTVARQAPLSVGLPRQEYWSGLSFPFPEDCPDPGIEPGSPTLQADFFTNWATREALYILSTSDKNGILFNNSQYHTWIMQLWGRTPLIHSEDSIKIKYFARGYK